MKKSNNNKKPLIRALEPRILFDGAAVTTAVDVLDNTSFNDASNSSTDSTQANDVINSTDSTKINDVTAPDLAAPVKEKIPVEAGDIFIITTDTPNYEFTAQNFSSNFKVIVLDQNSENLKSQIQDATKDLASDLNVHILAVNQNKDKLLVGSYDSVDEMLIKLNSDSKLYDLDDLAQEDFPIAAQNQVVVIDESISYAQNILDAIPKDWTVIKIDSSKDGLTQILEKLEGISDLSAIHIFSHGNSGEIILGNLVLNSNVAQERNNDLTILGSHLSQTGDILLYGCDVSSGYIGEEFVNLLADITNADIAASNDATGSYILSANFELETTSGNIESSVLEVDTNGNILGTKASYDINIWRDSQRLTQQASGNGAFGLWNSENNNWVDSYTSDQVVPYITFKTTTTTINFIFFSKTFTLTLPYLENYNYGTGVRYTETDFKIDNNSNYSITATISEQLKNYLGGEKGAFSFENFALYKKDANGVGFDKYNPLKNLVKASEGWFGELIYRGELESGDYTLVSSFDTFSLALFKVDVNYAEQMYGKGKLTVENLNRAPVFGTIADQTISGDGEKNIIATSWSNISDADGDEITVSAYTLNSLAENPLPDWLTFNPNTLTFKGNPPANVGTLNVRLVAFDGQITGYKDFKLTFTNDNDRPIVVNEIKDTIWESQGSFTYQIPTDTFADSDPGNDTFTYTAKLLDGSALPAWLSISSSGLISGNPPAGSATSLSIVVTANDGSGQANATQTDTFVLNLKNNNDIPTISNTSVSLNEDTTYTFKLADFPYTDTDTRSFDDKASGDGKTMKSIRIVELPENGTLWLDGYKVQQNQVIAASDITRLKYTPNENWAGHGALPPLTALLSGPDKLKWVSSDGYNDSSNTATLTLNVTLTNDDPQLSFSPGKTLNIRPSGGSPLSPVYVDQGLNLIDPDAKYSSSMEYDTIFSVSVTIVSSSTQKFITGDSLSLVNNGGFTVSYDSVNGILSIAKAGGARAAEYQEVLRTLQFSSSNTSDNSVRTLGLSFRTQDVGSKTSAYFDGVDDYIETMNASIPSSGDFTVSAWAKLADGITAGEYTIFGQGEGSNNVFLQILKNANGTYDLRIGNIWRIYNIDSQMDMTKWHQYTLSRTGSGSSDGSLYIDGKYIGSGDISTNIDTRSGLRIGRLYDQTFNSSSDWDGYFKGSISDLRVYNKALGALDIQKSLSNQLVGNEAGLTAWYKLESDYNNSKSGSGGGSAVVFKDANYGYSIKTGHYYRVDTNARDYSNATSYAQGQYYAGEYGYLVRLDDSLSSEEREVVKLMNSLKGSSHTWIGAERRYDNGDWYWTAGPDSDVYFSHGANEGLDNDPDELTQVYNNGGWSGVFGGSWKSTDWRYVDNLKTQITYTFYAWDSWDGGSPDYDHLEVKLNDTTLYNHYVSHEGRNTNTLSGTTNIDGKNISWRIVPSTGNTNLGRQSNYTDQTFSVVIDVPEGFEYIKLDFGAYLNQGLDDESAELKDIVFKTYNPEYIKDKAFIDINGYIDNQFPTNTHWSLIEYGNKGEYLSAPSLFSTSTTSLPDKYVNEIRSITVRQSNNAPTQTASWSPSAILEDTSLKFTASDFTSKFSDTDGDTLTKIQITQVPDISKGTLTLNNVVLVNGSEVAAGDFGKLVFKPNLDFNGAVTFKYKGSDGYIFTNESSVNITVNTVNDAPKVSLDETLNSINEDIAIVDNVGQTIASLITDGSITDVDGNVVEAIAITSVNNSYGTWQYMLASGSWANISNATGANINLNTSALLLNSDSLVRFIPNVNFNGTSSFEFRAWDKSTGVVGGTTNPFILGGNTSVSSEVKTATITVNPVNDAPTTLAKTITIDEDIAFVFTSKDFAFSDVDTADVLNSVKIVTLPTLGTIKLNGVAINAETVITKADIDAGKLTYISAQDGFGTAYSSFSFSVSDGLADSASATITFDVTDTNDAPTNISWASGGNVAENSGLGVIVGQLEATDPNTGETLRFSRVENSKFIISPTGLVTVAKDAYLDFEKDSTQTIKVKVTDSNGLTYIKDMTINITDVLETAPTLYTNVLYATKGTVTTLSESQIKTRDADTSDVNLIYTVKQVISGGVLFIDTNLDGIYNEGVDTILGPQSDENPQFVANFTHQDVKDGKIKFFKDNTQINAKISLEVSDGTTTDDGMVVVIVSNPPVVSAPIDDQEWGLSGVQSFTVPQSTFTDADYDVLTYSAKLSNGDSLPTWLSFDAKTGKFSGTPDSGLIDGSQIEITVTATDGRTTPASDTFIITFKAAITKPVIANPLPAYIEFNGSGVKSYTIPDGTFTNPLATTLTYSATLGNGNALPTWLVFNTATRTFSGNPPANAVGEPLILKITADNVTSTTSTTIKLYVSDSNDIPVNSAPITDKTISGTTTYTYTILKSTFSDGDNDAITLMLATKDGSDLPSWIQTTTDAAGNLIITAKAPAGSGEQYLRVIGNDGYGGEAISDFKISYSGGTNESPQVRTGDGMFYMEGGVLKTVPYGALEKFSIIAGKTSTITTEFLNENDPDDDGAGLTYTVVNEALYGQLWIDSDGNGVISGSEKTLSAGDTFTQKDIDDKKLKYKHTAQNTIDDKFVFNLKDGGENGSLEVKNVTFNIDVLTNPASLSIVSITRYIPTASLTNSDEVQFKVKFSDVTYKVDASDFAVTGAGNTGATITKVQSIGSNEYMITVSNIALNNGTVGIALKATTDIITSGGTAIDKTFVPTINETFILDNTNPTVTITPDRTIYAGTTPFKATITFNEEIFNFTKDDISVTNASVSNLVKIDNFNYTFDVTASDATANIVLNFASDKANDAAGNSNTAASEVTITRNSLTTISSTSATGTFIEVDGIDTASNDVLFSAAGISFADTDTNQNLQSLIISIPTDSILDGAKEELIVNGTAISLNFANGKAIANITVGVGIDAVEYKITATINGANSILTFEKVSGKMSFAEAKTLVDAMKYNNSSDTPTTTTNRVFSVLVNDGLENSAPSNITISVVATNDTPVILSGASAELIETNTTLSTNGTLSVTDLDTTQTVSVSSVGVVSSGITNGLISDNTALLAMLSLNSSDVITNDSTNGTITWAFNSGSEYFDYLADGEVLTLTYTIKATDSSAKDSASQTIVITITGTNDTPNITGNTTTALSNATPTNVTGAGKLTFVDIDKTDTPMASFVKATDTSYTAIRADVNSTPFELNTTAIGKLQDALILNPSNGTWAYALDTTSLKDSGGTIIALGDKITVSYKITVADANGGSVTKDLKFTLVGTGTGASLVVNGDAGSIVEGSKLSDAGSLTFDNYTSAEITSTVTASTLTLTLAQETAIKNAFVSTATGNIVDWTYNITEANLDFLPANEIVTAVFTIDSQNVTIVINGTNDIPIITSTVTDARGSVVEAGTITGTATITGNLTSSDVDSGATQNWTLNTPTGTYGNIAIDSATGIWTYTLDDTKAATKALQTGDKRTETFIATITDDKGAIAQQTIIVEVNGTNDAPVLTTPTIITYTDTSINDIFAETTGTLISSDDDVGDTKVFSITAQIADTTQSGFTHSELGTYGTLYLNALSGAYKYIPNDAAINALTADNSETFSFTVTDALGASNTQTLTINLTGANDTPTIKLGANDSDAKSLYETNSSLVSDGTLSIEDLDLLNTVSASVISCTDATALSMLTLNANPILNDSQTSNTLTWTFNSGSEHFNYLSQGDTKTLVYTIRVSDGTVDVDKIVTITILGTNDAPSITVEAEDATSATLSETNATLSASDTITINEVEPNDTVSASVESVSVNASSTVPSLALPSNAVLKAMLALNKSSLLTDNALLKETLTWTFNSGTEHFDKIAFGETLVLDYVIKVADSANPSKIDTKVITITINGTNDAPIIETYATNDANINGEIESGKPLKLADTGSINFKDVDFSNRPTATQAFKSITALRRDGTTTFTLTDTQQTNIVNAFKITADSGNTNNGVINWEYAISQANIDFLGAGEQVSVVYTITVTDSAGVSAMKDITIKLAGENKTPTLTSSTKDINESNTAIDTTISMTAEDKNMSDSLTVSVLSGTYKLNSDTVITMTAEQLAWLSIANNPVVDGTFNWNFNTNGKTFNELNTGETVRLVYTVQVIDDAPIPASSTQTVTVTITGTNDAPVAVMDTASTSENSSVTLDVLANDTDPDSLDNSANFTLNSVTITTNMHSSGYNASKVTTIATATIVDNKLVFNPNDEFDYLAQNDTATVVVTYEMKDDEGLTSTNTATITITGTNDNPAITVKSSDKISEDFIESSSAITTSGTLSLNDKDTLNTVSASVDSVSISGTSQVGILTNEYFKSMLTLTSADILNNATNDGKITWNFNSGSDAFAYIAKGEELVLTYTIKALDSSDGSHTQTVTIKITGTNNAPSLTAINSITYIDTNVDDTFASHTGTLESSDADISDIKTYSITDQTADASESGFTHSKLGNYGKLYVNQSTGAYKYIPNDTKIEELTTNQTDTFTFNVMDDSADFYNIDTKTFVVNLVGTNDIPVITVESGNSASETLNETDTTLSTSGTLSIVDLDTTQTVSVTKVGVVASNNTNGLISNNSALLDMLSITPTPIDTTAQNGTISWAFNSGSEAFNYLASGEILTLTYTIKATDDDSSLSSDTVTVVIKIVGTNDVPTVLVDNIDGMTSFGKEFSKETAYLFADLDKTDIFKFEASNLPLGLSINPSTGQITGRAVESGVFVITLKATDSGTPSLNVTRTFSLLVVAPPQNDVAQTPPERSTNDVAQQIIREITVDRITEIINSSTTTMLSMGENNQSENLADALLGGLNNNSFGRVNSNNVDITRTELTAILPSGSTNPNDKLITANANLNFDNSGKVNFSKNTNGAFQTVGLTIERIDLVQDQIEIKVLDTRVGQKYIVTLLDGSELPDTLSFDPNTGKIIGVLPAGMTELNISIKALSNDGTTRILNLKIDLKELKKNQTAFNSLSKQIETQNNKMTSYGDFISSLFDKSIAV